MLALISSTGCFIVSCLFYYQKKQKLPYLKVASLFTSLSWLVIGIRLFVFVKTLNLLSPYEDVLMFTVVMVLIQVLIWLVAHGFERFDTKN